VLHLGFFTYHRDAEFAEGLLKMIFFFDFLGALSASAVSHTED